jgi:type IV pilus assembly protein PilN
VQQINFFKPYFADKKIKPKQKIIYVSSFIAVVLIGLAVWNFGQIILLKSRIAEQNKFLSSTDAQGTKLKLDEAQDNIKKMDNYLKTVNQLAQGLQKEERINRQLLDKIAAMVLNGLSFQAFSLTDSVFSLQGTASTRTAIAELQHQLQTSDIFQNIQVKNIVIDSSENAYKFSIEGMLK